ncbi:YqjD family protein [Aureimonas sp. AU22]|jgi:ElaB/YqjD/DUF883 family membrane-anchored ribosome-binding protein|uniref:DUF883 family protein n=1 Tax=Aureimonas sp. AU22 TaxID=1638162 RepID=UPI000784E6AE|nr:hypothetical protein [Aureimonas sp. AU22]
MSESTSNEFSANAGPDRADLEAQIAKLREDVAGVTETLKSMATSRAEGAKQQAYALREEGERYFRQAQETVGEFEEEVSERVRAEPIKSILIAAAVGYVYARLFK